MATGWAMDEDDCQPNDALPSQAQRACSIESVSDVRSKTGRTTKNWRYTGSRYYQTIATRGITRSQSQEFMNDEGFSSSRLHMPRPVWLDAWLLPRREQAAEVWRKKGRTGDWEFAGSTESTGSFWGGSGGRRKDRADFLARGLAGCHLFSASGGVGWRWKKGTCRFNWGDRGRTQRQLETSNPVGRRPGEQEPLGDQSPAWPWNIIPAVPGMPGMSFLKSLTRHCCNRLGRRS
ncbi:hypothetical protein V8F33_000114 [Rhypophila sp. PSN 637]